MVVMRIAVAVAALLLSFPARAQQAGESFHGGALRPTFAAGVSVTTTQRNGAEILRIRATNESAEPFLATKLPPVPKANPFKIYNLNLTLGPGLTSSECGRNTAAREDFERCLGKAALRREGSWLTWAYEERPSSKYVLARSASTPRVYANCWLFTPPMPGQGAIQPSCNFYFEQDGHWHSVDTTARAFFNLRPYRCAALQLRNAIWEGAPKLPPTCGKSR
jgi:hypothetical protein